MDRYIDNPNLFMNIVDLHEYYVDLEEGNLSGVSFVKVIGSSEHPPGSLQAGQRAARTMIHALMQSSHWETSAFFVTYDDWGGWYDHVPPPQVDEYGYGFRVPALLVSPYAKKGYIDSTVLDYTSILRFIEDNWDLEPLSVRDAKANSIINAFDFNQAPRPAQIIPSTRYFSAQQGNPNTLVVSLAYAGFFILALGVIFWAWNRNRPSRLMENKHGSGEGNCDQ
jgi:phospholipase C